VRPVGALLAGWLLLIGSPLSAAQALYDPSHAELRGGYFIGVPLPYLPLRIFPERGTSDLNLELVLPKWWRAAPARDWLLPRLNAGTTVNLDGRTSFLYGGGLWTYDYTARGFVELSVGGMVHNGQLTGSDPRLARLGCRALYALGLNLGYRLGFLSNLMLSFEHGSNGHRYLSGCPVNQGLDLLGIRFAYRL
jgi:lipid A 3-O-deacylase